MSLTLAETRIPEFVNCMFALALIDPIYVHDAYTGLLNNNVQLLGGIYGVRLHKLLKNFETHCLTKKTEEDRTERWYPGPSTVSHLNIRTNNYIEGWHHYWNSVVMKGQKHKNVWNFICQLQQEQTKNELRVSAHESPKWSNDVEGHMDRRGKLMARLRTQLTTQNPEPISPYDAILTLSRYINIYFGIYVHSFILFFKERHYFIYMNSVTKKPLFLFL